MVKKLIIILVVLVVILALILFLRPKKNEPIVNDPIAPQTQPVIYQAEFLTDAEKTKLDIPTETKVQSLKKNANGEVEVYKIIRNDWDIVTDLSTVGPISPRNQ